MNREEAKELLPVIQAFADGDNIEYLSSNGNWVWAGSHPTFSEGRKYRVKPKPFEGWTVLYDRGHTVSIYQDKLFVEKLLADPNSSNGRVIKVKEVI